jgi:hypothetical protein
LALPRPGNSGADAVNERYDNDLSKEGDKIHVQNVTDGHNLDGHEIVTGAARILMSGSFNQRMELNEDKPQYPNGNGAGKE